MAVLKCKMCGGNIDVTDGLTVVECEYCGTKQTVPDVNDEKKLNLYNRANRLRMSSEFDKAGSIYEQIIAEFPEEAEAYWGLCLCNYGIEYVDDPATAAKIPTVHRASFEKLRKDENYELALEYADISARVIYEDSAREIDRIMGEILSISANESPYDVFICYKETDNKGDRTPDSVIAQDIYDELTKKGYKVFFSRITLEDKLGMQYEPYIFAALNSAKVMLAIGTDYEYYNAVWVKNEWSRFIKLAAKDKSKILIPCFKDMDAYDMPEQFKGLQAQDMGKLGFMQDLIRGIDKIFGRENQPKTTAAAQNTATQSSPTVRSMLERAGLFLEDKDFGSADEYADKVLDIEPTNADAYLIKLLAQYEATGVEDFPGHFNAPWENNGNVTILNYGLHKIEVIKIVRDITGLGLAEAKEAVEKLPYTIPVRVSNDTIREFEALGTKIACSSSLNELKSNPNYQKIERFGDSVQKENLGRIISAINERHCEMLCRLLEEAGDAENPEKYAACIKAYSDTPCANKAREIFDRKTEQFKQHEYDGASQTAAFAETEEDFEVAAAEFDKISGFKDADSRADECRKKAEQARLEAERKTEEARLENERKAKEAKLEAERIKREFEVKVESVVFALKNTNLNTETQKLENEISALQKLLCDFDSNITRLNYLKSQSATLQGECDRLSQQISSLGMFKFKEKTEFSDKLSQVKTELDNTNKEIAEHNTRYNGYESKEKLTEAIKVKQAELAEFIEMKNFGMAEYSFAEAKRLVDSDEQLKTAILKKYPEILLSVAEVGSFVTFGSYPQAADGAKKPIEWLVLEKKENQVLLISRYALNCKQFNRLQISVTWESCILRRWLNDEFINTAFTQEQQSMIAFSNVPADKNHKYLTPSGHTVKDKIFLLSIPEAERYFKTYESRKCYPTAYARAQGASTNDEGLCWWWLRSPGGRRDTAAGVDYVGPVTYYGYSVHFHGTIRPALRINLDS